MKRLEEAQATLQATVEDTARALMFGDESEQEAAEKELERVKKWFGDVVDNMASQARGLRMRNEKFQMKWDDSPLGNLDVIEEHHLLVTHNGSQWTGLRMTLTEMVDIRDFLTEKLVQCGVQPDPKLVDPERRDRK